MALLSNKIALITGGTQSIGKATAELFHDEGAKVIITGRRSVDEGNKIAQSIGDDVYYLQLDVKNEAHWQKARQYIVTNFTKLDVLINNAGIEQPQTKALQNPEYCTLADWQTVHDTNLNGVFLAANMPSA